MTANRVLFATYLGSPTLNYYKRTKASLQTLHAAKCRQSTYSKGEEFSYNHYALGFKGYHFFFANARDEKTVHSVAPKPRWSLWMSNRMTKPPGVHGLDPRPAGMESSMQGLPVSTFAAMTSRNGPRTLETTPSRPQALMPLSTPTAS